MQCVATSASKPSVEAPRKCSVGLCRAASKKPNSAMVDGFFGPSLDSSAGGDRAGGLELRQNISAHSQSGFVDRTDRLGNRCKGSFANYIVSPFSSQVEWSSPRWEPICLSPACRLPCRWRFAQQKKEEQTTLSTGNLPTSAFFRPGNEGLLSYSTWQKPRTLHEKTRSQIRSPLPTESLRWVMGSIVNPSKSL